VLSSYPQIRCLGSHRKYLPTLLLAAWGVLSPLPAGILHVTPLGKDKAGDGSLTKPWATIQHAVNNSGAGDTILVAPGTYKERIEVTESGNPTAGFLTIMGEDGAIISGQGLTGESSLLIDNQSYIRLINLQFTENKSSTESYGVLIQGGGNHLEVINCQFTKLVGKNAVAIAVHGSDAKSPLQKIKIDGCTISHCQPAPSEALVLNGNVDGFEVTNNVITDVNNIAIDFIGGEADTVKDITKVARNGICRANRVERARSTYEDGYAAGIYVDGGRDILIEENAITQCDLGIEIGAENKGLVTSGITIRKNNVYLNDKAGIAIGGYETAVGRVKNCLIVENTFYKNTMAKESQGELWLQQAADNEISGNSFWVRPGTLMVAADAGGLKNKICRNRWWCDAGPEEVRWLWGGDPSQGYKAYLSTSKQDADSTFAKPEHPDPEKGQFKEISMN
jgi:hypothetical protein